MIQKQCQFLDQADFRKVELEGPIFKPSITVCHKCRELISRTSAGIRQVWRAREDTAVKIFQNLVPISHQKSTTFLRTILSSFFRWFFGLVNGFSLLNKFFFFFGLRTYWRVHQSMFLFFLYFHYIKWLNTTIFYTF